MSQQNKNKLFLDKFQGRTNRIGKSGMQSILTPKNSEKFSETNNQNNQEHLRNIDLDSLIPSNPNKNSRQSNQKRGVYMIRPLKNPQRQEYTPSNFTPQGNSSKDDLLSSLAPSRSLSNSTNNSRGKYIFGKYLKLDKQAVGHMQFLQALDQKSLFKKSLRRKSIALS